MRARNPEIVAFPLNEPGHFVTVFMRLNCKQQIEVFVLDSIWAGDSSRVWRNIPTGAEYDKSTGKLQALIDPDLVFDGFNACLIAMIADACWPLQGGARHQEIVQRTPLVPHQGYTNDCGVFTVIYFAGLFLKTD